MLIKLLYIFTQRINSWTYPASYYFHLCGHSHQFPRLLNIVRERSINIICCQDPHSHKQNCLHSHDGALLLCATVVTQERQTAPGFRVLDVKPHHDELHNFLNAKSTMQVFISTPAWKKHWPIFNISNVLDAVALYTLLFGSLKGTTQIPEVQEQRWGVLNQQHLLSASCLKSYTLTRLLGRRSKHVLHNYWLETLWLQNKTFCRKGRGREIEIFNCIDCFYKLEWLYVLDIMTTLLIHLKIWVNTIK